MFKTRQYENLHIPLWLLKDTCWMLHWKLFGIIMIVPTIAVAFIIVLKNWYGKKDSFWINLAVLFWILGNSYWMLCEFFDHEELKDYAGAAFVAGMLSVAYFYKKRLINKNP